MPQLLVENFVKSLNFQHFWLIFVAFWTRCRNFCDTSVAFAFNNCCQASVCSGTSASFLNLQKYILPYYL